MGVISIIKEEVSGFLNELENEDIVDVNTLNLQAEYDKLNELLFGGSLSRVPMKWDNSKTHLGVVSSLRNRLTGEMRVVSLAMSKYYKTNYRQFKNTLAHEMIHVKQIFTEGSANHQWSFYSESRRINGMGLGFHITPKNTEEIQMSDTVKGNAKTLVAIIFDIDGQYYLSVTTPSVYASDFDFLVNYYQREVNRGKHRKVEISVVESRNPELMGKRILRSFQRSFSFIRMPEGLFEQLLNDKIIKSVKITRGVPAEVSEEVLPNANAGEWEKIEIV
jgi:hypothetical protein